MTDVRAGHPGRVGYGPGRLLTGTGEAELADPGAWACDRPTAAKRPRASCPLVEPARTSTGKVRRPDLPEVLEKHPPGPPPLAGSRRGAAGGPTT